MRAGTSIRSVFGKALTAFIAALVALPTAPARADNWNLNSYVLTLRPTERTPIRMYDLNSRYLGELSSESYIPLTVTGEMVRRSMVNGTPNMGQILRQAAYQDANGNWALLLTTNQTVVTREGNQIPAQTRVLVALNDFLANSPDDTGSTMTVNQPAPDSPAAVDSAGSTNFDPLDEFDDVTEFEDETADSTPEPEIDETVEITRLRGSPFPSRFLSAPVCNCGTACRFGSPFGPRPRCRTKNGRRCSRNHMGQDIPAPTGTPIVAAADGEISRRPGPNGGYGTTVFVGHGNGFETQYSHLSRLAPGLRVGMRVKRGDIIGYAGETGNATGPHLHMNLLRDGRAVNPMPYFLSGAGTNSGLRQRCDRMTVYPTTDEAMANALAGGGRSSSRTGSR